MPIFATTVEPNSTTMKLKYLLVVIGPTAIGKTALSIKLAQHFRCEIVSCDSRQFFKEMRIGTAVPDACELAAAPHHFIHSKSIFEPYNVGDFENDAIAKLDELFETSDFAILVGGSGLYVNAVLQGFDDFPEVPETIRLDLLDKYKRDGISFLQNELRQRDPDYYKIVDVDNPQRIMRALEVCLATGQPYSAFRKQKKNPRNFTPVIIGLEAERQVLYDRINHRVDLMMEAGLFKEAKTLYPHRNLNSLQTVGYRELFAHLDGEITLDFAVEEIKKNTRRFAKRQLTWFKRTEETKWFDYQTDIQQIIDYIQNQIR